MEFFYFDSEEDVTQALRGVEHWLIISVEKVLDGKWRVAKLKGK